MLPLTKDLFENRIARAPGWMIDIRRRGFDLFEKLAPPSSKEEVWRYVDLDFELADFGLPASPGPGLAAAESLAGLSEPAGRATVIDGFVTQADGEAHTLASVGDRAEVTAAYGSGVPADLDLFSAAHHAFADDGVVVSVPDGTVLPGVVVVDVQASTSGGVSFPHLTVLLGTDAEASIVMVCRSPMDVDALVVPHVEARVGDGSRLRFTQVQRWGYRTRAIAQQRLVAGRDASIVVGEVGLGGALGRLHFTYDLEGRGGGLEMYGLYFGELDQVIDYRGFINHRAPNTTSNMYLKGAVEDRSHSVFTGLIRIEEQAQHVDAFQTNRNLVLSDGAGAESVPNLEILANDVKCGHGSTVGPLDEDQRYYLMSRGLDRLRSDRLQVRGFFEEVVARLPQPELAGPVRRLVNAKYTAAQEAGRV